MQDTSHFHVQGSFENNNIDLHFRNIEDNDVIQVLQGPFSEGIQEMTNAEELNGLCVKRKTVIDEVKRVIEDNEFTQCNDQERISECFNKVLKLQNKGVPIEKHSQDKILQLQLNKNKRQRSHVNDVIQDDVYQSKQSTVSPTVKRGTENNKDIKSIHVIHPNDASVEDKFLRYLSQNKLKLSITALSVIYDVKALTIILMDKNGKTENKLIVRISEVIFSQIGTSITLALTSFLPGIGSFVIGVLSGIIFGFIGKKIGELILSLCPKVALGDGAPILDYFSFVYGSNALFGEPLNEYNIEAILAVPKLDYNYTSLLKTPTNKHDDKYIQMLTQVPK